MEQLSRLTELERALIEPLAAYFAEAEVTSESGTMEERLARRLEQLPPAWKTRCYLMPPSMTGVSAYLMPSFTVLGLRLAGCDAFVSVYADRERAYFETLLASYRAIEAKGEVPPAMLFFCVIEAGMILAPWRLHWPQAAALRETLEPILLKACREYPAHPGLAHLNCHFHEVGPQVELARESAEALARGIGGEDHGHLLHMAGHVLVQLGRHNESMRANMTAVIADKKASRERGDQVFNFLGLHDQTFVIWGAMHSGQKAICMAATREFREALQPMQGVLAMMYHISATTSMSDVASMIFMPFLYMPYVRFGLWDELLALPAPSQSHDIHFAFYSYARGVALAATGNVAGAEAELSNMRSVLSHPSFEWRELGIVSGLTIEILRVDEAWLEGEIEYRKMNYDTAFAKLREAAELGDKLVYMEPPPVAIPPRHALGALLLESGRVTEAEAAYREELEPTTDAKKRRPNSIWAILGLLKCLEAKGAAADPTEVESLAKQLEAAKAIAVDFEATASCACATKGQQREVAKTSCACAVAKEPEPLV